MRTFILSVFLVCSLVANALKVGNTVSHAGDPLTYKVMEDLGKEEGISCYAVAVTGISGTGVTRVTVPTGWTDTANGYKCKVVRIDHDAFKGRKELKYLKIAEGVTTIGSGSLQECTGLDTLYIPSTVTSLENIDHRNFPPVSNPCMQNCGSGSSESYISIGANLSVSVYNFYTIHVGPKVESLKNIHPYNMLVKLVIDSQLTKDMEEMKAAPSVNKSICKLWEKDYETYVNAVTFGPNVEEIYPYMFATKGMAGMEYVVIGENVKKIGMGAFSGQEYLYSVENKSEVLERIGDKAFSGCVHLGEFTIPASVTYIGSHAFDLAEWGEFYLRTLTVNSAAAPDRQAFSEELKSYTEVIAADKEIADIYAGMGFTNVRTESVRTVKSGYLVNTLTDRIRWSLYANGDLVINSERGLGVIPDYKMTVDLTTKTAKINSPWYSVGDKVKKVYLSEGITRVGNYAFTMPSNDISYIQLPNSLKQIGAYAFVGNKLEALVVPGKVTTIGEAAFAACQNLKSVEMPVMLEHNSTKAGRKMFMGCSRLEKVSFFNTGDLCISDSMFVGCASLKYLYIHATTVPTVTSRAFRGVTLGNIMAFVDATLVDAYKADATFSQFQDIVGMRPQITLSWDEEESTLTVKGEGGIPDNYAPLREYYKKAKKVKISSGITSIGSGAFFAYNEMERITLPVGLAKIGNSALKGCSALETLTLPSTMRHVGKGAFTNLASITTLRIPASLGDIAEVTTQFEGCDQLKSIQVETGNKTYCSYSNCLFSADSTVLYFIPKGIVSLKIPAPTTDIADVSTWYEAFKGDNIMKCEQLKTITVAEGNKMYSAYANTLYEKNQLIQIAPASTKAGIISSYETIDYLSTEYSPFAGHKLQAVSVQSGHPKYSAYKSALCSDNRAVLYYYPSALKEVEFYAKVKVIDSYAIADNDSVTEIVVPNGVEEIVGRGIYNCHNLRVLTLPASIAEIGEEAFMGCESLTTIYASNEELFSASFEKNVYDDCTVFADNAIVAQEYKRAGFKNVFDLSETVPATMEGVNLLIKRYVRGDKTLTMEDIVNLIDKCVNSPSEDE